MDLALGTNLLSFKVVGEGRPLLFIHGLGADKTQTLSALSALPNTQLIAPDIRAHGESEWNGEALTFNQFADDLIKILDQLNLKKVDIGGLSMGSGIALNLALRYPNRVNKIVLLRPSWLDTECPPHLKLVADAGHYIEQHGLEAGQEQLKKYEPFNDLLQSNPEVAKSILGLFVRPQAIKGASVLHKMWHSRPYNSLSELRIIQNKILILYTEKDDLHPKSVAQKIHLSTTNSCIKELPTRYYEKQAYTDELLCSVSKFLQNEGEPSASPK